MRPFYEGLCSHEEPRSDPFAGHDLAGSGFGLYAKSAFCGPDRRRRWVLHQPLPTTLVVQRVSGAVFY